MYCHRTSLQRQFRGVEAGVLVLVAGGGGYYRGACSAAASWKSVLSPGRKLATAAKSPPAASAPAPRSAPPASPARTHADISVSAHTQLSDSRSSLSKSYMVSSLLCTSSSFRFTSELVEARASCSRSPSNVSCSAARGGGSGGLGAG